MFYIDPCLSITIRNHSHGHNWGVWRPPAPLLHTRLQLCSGLKYLCHNLKGQSDSTGGVGGGKAGPRCRATGWQVILAISSAEYLTFSCVAVASLCFSRRWVSYFGISDKGVEGKSRFWRNSRISLTLFVILRWLVSMGPVAFSQVISMSPTFTMILWVSCSLLEYSSTEIFFVLPKSSGAGAGGIIVMDARSKVIFSGIMKVSGSNVVPGGTGLPGVLGTDVFLGD